MAITYLAGRRIQGTQADFGDNGAGIPAVSGGWVELGRTTLGSAGDTISVSSLPDKKYYMILKNVFGSGLCTDRFTFNSDTGSNYAWRKSANGASDSTAVNQVRQITHTNADLDNAFFVGYVSNLANKEKLHINHATIATTTGASTAPIRDETVSKWSNTSDAISTMTMTNDQSGDYNTGSEMIVLGWDPADTHTTNFWEELASVDLSGGDASSLSTSTITAKKYLWVQFFVEVGTTNDDVYVRFNSDTGSNYSWRRSIDGGSDSTNTSNTSIDPEGSLQTSQPMFANMFIINNSGNEKLVIGNTTRSNTAGAGNAPTRREWAAKWANTSNAITEVSLTAQSGNLKSKTIMKVWGSD